MSRRAALILLCAAALVLAPFAALCFGRFPIAAGEALSALFPSFFGEIENAELTRGVLLNIRLPRVALAMLAGAGLAVSGAAFQSLFSNPLATPDTLGVATGASFGAALGILAGFSPAFVQLSAFAAGLAAVALVLAVSRVRGSSPVIMMILAGMVVSALFSALVSLVKFAADPQDVLPAITFWLMGSLSGATRESLALGSPAIILGVLIIWLARWRLNAASLSDDEAVALGVNLRRLRLAVIAGAAVALGVNLRRLRLAVIAGAALITGAVVSMCGLIGWVGLLVPHGSRMLFGADNRRVVPASLVLGALFMLAIDTASRSAAASEIPASILTSIIGAPFFIFLLRRSGGIRE